MKRDTNQGTCTVCCPQQPGELEAVFATAASNVVSAPAKDLGGELNLAPQWPELKSELEPWMPCDQRPTLQPLAKATRRGEPLLLSVAVTLATIS